MQALGPERLNVPEDIPAGEAEWPGEFPYTRGIHPTGYRGRLWTMRQYAGFGTATESNARYRYLLDHPDKFDTSWVKRFIRRFGLYPIGSLVRFDDASLGWVLALDDQGRPSRVQRMAGKPPSQVPREPLMGPVVEGETLASLGETLASLGEIQAEVIIGA